MSELVTKTSYANAEFTFGNVALFKTLIDTISNFGEEVTFGISVEALTVTHMDMDRVAMCRYVLPKEVFEEWHVDTEGVFCIDLSQVLKIVFASFRNDTKLQVVINGEDNPIVFKLRDTRTRKRNFPALSIPDDYFEDRKAITRIISNVPIEQKAKFKMVANTFAKDLKDLQKISDHVYLEGTENQLKVYTTGDLTSGENVYKKGSDILLDLQVNKDEKACYSVERLLEQGVIPKLGDIATLAFGTGQPIKIEMYNRDMMGLATIEHYIAPRIDVD